MRESDARGLIERKYALEHGAKLTTSFDDFLISAKGAVVGYRPGGSSPLFLEAYLDTPIECAVSGAIGRSVERGSIIEIGNLASDNALAMVELWGAAANDLGSRDEIVVATLTQPLRRMFGRIGIPIVELCEADPGRLGAAARDWGSYYALDPIVCAGEIGPGQEAIAAFFARRTRRAVA